MIQDGIEVYVKTLEPPVAGERREEYQASYGTDIRGNDNLSCYLEAIDDARFAVLVTILPEFDWRGASVVRIKLSLDDGVITSSCNIKKPMTFPYTKEFRHKNIDKDAHTRQRIGFNFGKINLSACGVPTETPM